MRNKLLFALFFISVILTVKSQCEREANFQAGPDYSVDGKGTLTFLSNGTKTLSFDSNFDTPSGPDLHVYLSNSSTVNSPGGVLDTPNTIDLGLLKQTSGAQTYDLTSNTALTLNKYEYIVIHCSFHNHPWGYGKLNAVFGNDCSTLNLNETEIGNNIAIYPSIVKQGKIYIEINNIKNTSVSIYSISGSQMITPIPLMDKKNIIDVSELPSGIYFITFIADNNRITKKIIIQ